jgi:arsenate reductase
MNDRIYEVLFVCTHNSARSIMAEGLLNALGQGRFHAHSAGSHPAGTVHPMALRTLARMHLPAEGYRSKDWCEFAQPGAPMLDFVLTVCDKAAGEVCPARVFWDTASVLKRRIELMMALPMAALDSLALQQHMREIGSS